MKEVSNEIMQETEEAASIINEYKQKLTEVIGKEKEGLRKKAEQESAVKDWVCDATELLG